MAKKDLDVKLKITADAKQARAQLDGVADATGRIGSAADKASPEMRALVEEMDKLAAEKGLIETYTKLETSLGNTEKAMAGAKREVAFLRDGMEKAGKKGADQFRKDLEKAKKEVLRLAEKQRNYQKGLKELTGEMKKSGLGATNLADRQKQISKEYTAAKITVAHLDAQLKKTRAQAAKPLPDNTQKLRAGAKDTTKALSSIRAQILGLLSIAGMKRLGASVIDASDAWKQYEAQLKLATDSAEEQAIAEQALYEISQDTRTDLGANIALYARLARSRDELNVSQETLLKTTDLLTRGLKISGATATEAESTMLQLSQALGAGALRGEELNSVMENGGRVAKALADGLGVPIGALKEMGKQGELTSRKVIDALLSQRDAINEEFKALPQTVDGSLTKIANRYQQFIGESEGVGVATEQLIGLLNALADNFDEVAELALTAGKVIVAAFAVKGVAALRGYVAELAVATQSTAGLTAATAAQGKAATVAAGATKKLAGALKAAGWIAVALEIMEIVGNLSLLYSELQKHERLERDIADTHQLVAEKLQEIGRQTGLVIPDMATLNKLAKEGKIAFDEASNKWVAGAEALDRLAQKAKEAGQAVKTAVDDFETDIDVKNSFFSQMMGELQTLTTDGIPAYVTKLAEMREANLLTDGHVDALRITLVDLQRQIENTGGEIKVTIRKETIDGVTSFTDGLSDIAPNAAAAADSTDKLADKTNKAGKETKDAADITKMSVDEYIEHRKATRAAAAAQGAQGDAATEAGAATEAAGGQMSGASSIAQLMADTVEHLAGNLRALSPAAEEAFRAMLPHQADALTATEAVRAEIAATEQEVMRLRRAVLTAGNPFSKWFNRVYLAAEKVKLEFQHQAEAADILISRLSGMDTATEQVITSARQAASGYQLLDDATLSGIISEVDRLARANDQMAASAERALQSYQDMVDRQRGDDLAIAERERARALEELEEQLQAARKAGNQEVIRDLEQAMALARQYHAEEIAMLRAKLEGEQSITRERERQGAIPTLPATITPPGTLPADPRGNPATTLPIGYQQLDPALLQSLNDIRDSLSDTGMQLRSAAESSPAARVVQLRTPDGAAITGRFSDDDAERFLHLLADARMVAK